MNEVVILCSVYPQVINALYVASHSIDNHPVYLITGGDLNLLKFFNIVNERVFHNRIDIRYFKTYRGEETKNLGIIKKNLCYFKNIIGEKKLLKGIFKEYMAWLRGAEVFFFNRFFSPEGFYFLRKLDKSNRLIYMQASSYDSFEVEMTGPEKLRELAYLARWKLVYGCEMGIGRHSLGQIIPFMTDKFFESRISRIINRAERDSMLSNFDLNRFRVFDTGDYKVMYFHDDVIQYGYISDPSPFIKLLNDVFQILTSYYPKENVACKYHPSTTEKTEIHFGDVLPEYIPAEFLYNDKVDLYLGLFSMSLANVEKGRVISLIEMVAFRDGETKKRIKKILVQASKTKILFPKSLEEFEQILIGLGLS